MPQIARIGVYPIFRHTQIENPSMYIYIYKNLQNRRSISPFFLPSNHSSQAKDLCYTLAGREDPRCGALAKREKGGSSLASIVVLSANILFQSSNYQQTGNSAPKLSDAAKNFHEQ